MNRPTDEQAPAGSGGTERRPLHVSIGWQTIWKIIAAILITLAGVLNAVYGLMMLFNSDRVVFTADGAWPVDISTWVGSPWS